MLNKTEEDLLKKVKNINRVIIGFEKSKITKSKKKYRRKKFRYKQDDND